jgi:Protein of unknown function (DUF402)
MRRFEPGETVVRRDVFGGSVWSAHALRALEDRADALVTACRPGAETLMATTFIESQPTGDDATRKQALPDLAAGRWQLDRWLWRDTALLMWNRPGAYFSVNAFYDTADGHRMRCWYVNFERPARRTAIGFDTFDLLVDLVVEPDLSAWRWKDEDEYAQGRRLGVVNDTDHRAVDEARGQVLAMIEDREGPFAGDSRWPRWRSEESWPAPRLPDGVLTLPAESGGQSA